MKRTFKEVEIEGEIYLYPIPVIKDHKYLIKCGTPEQAGKMLTLLETAAIIHPDETGHKFELIGHHTDGKTPILMFRS